MAKYLSEIKNVPKPTEQQISNFINYVASVHSWYKHLPKTLPGVPFYFFIDPNAGCHIHVPWIGRPKAVVYEVRPEKMISHNNWMPTNEYRRQCGYLQYYTQAATKIANAKWTGVERTENLQLNILGTQREWISLPKKILEAGCVNLTASVYPGEEGQAAQLQEMRGAIDRMLQEIYGG